MKPTIVIFRKWKDTGDVIALFPESPSDCQTWWNCESYMHVGQHSGADYLHCLTVTVPAKPKEYAQLKRELYHVGYRKLVVRQRESSAMRMARRKEWETQMRYVA